MPAADGLALVIFDCDGVLVDTERRTIDVEVLVCREMGWNLTADEVIERFCGRTDEYVTAELGRHLGRELPPDWDAPWRDRYLDVLNAAQPVPGILSALDRITLPTCVASSGSYEKMDMTLGRTGLLDRFRDRIFSAVDVAAGKPAPDLFLHAARQMGAAPDRCAVVEDSVAGITAARAAGMRALGYSGSVTPAARLAAAGATVFADMRTLPELLATFPH